jgi:hypothetical protein
MVRVLAVWRCFSSADNTVREGPFVKYVVVGQWGRELQLIQRQGVE